MLSALTILGSVLTAAIGFLVGRFFAESERILSEKRKAYLEFLSELPPLNDTYLDTSNEEFLATLRPAIERLPSLIFYADKSVLMAWARLQQSYLEAHTELTLESPAPAPAYQALAIAQNDLILEMRRDAGRWSIFKYSGKTRAPDRLTIPNK